MVLNIKQAIKIANDMGYNEQIRHVQIVPANSTESKTIIINKLVHVWVENNRLRCEW
jgi:hypothetical protein